MPGPKKMKAGSYAAGTKAQLQGKGENKTVQDLKHLADGSGRENIAVRKTMQVGDNSYETFLAKRKTPEGQQAKAAYEQKNRLGSLSDRDYAARVFAESQQNLKQRAARNASTSLITTEAASAATKASTTRAIEKGNYAQPTAAGAVVDGKTQQQFYADQASVDGTAKAAPGSTPVQLAKTPRKTAGVATYGNGTKKMKAGKKC